MTISQRFKEWKKLSVKERTTPENREELRRLASICVAGMRKNYVDDYIKFCEFIQDYNDFPSGRSRSELELAKLEPRIVEIIQIGITNEQKIETREEYDDTKFTPRVIIDKEDKKIK